MLVLTRKNGEEILLPQLDVVITVVDIRNGRVRIGITAPRETVVLRRELLEPRGATAAGHEARPPSR